MKRRDVIKSVSGAGIIGISGCSSFVEKSGTILGRVEVINFSNTNNRISLIVKRDDSVIFQQDIGLIALNDCDGVPAEMIEPIWSKEEGEYTIRATHINKSGNLESLQTEYTFTSQDYEKIYNTDGKKPACIGAVVKIGSLSEEPNGQIGIGPVYVQDPC